MYILNVMNTGKDVMDWKSNSGIALCDCCLMKIYLSDLSQTFLKRLS